MRKRGDVHCASSHAQLQERDDDCDRRKGKAPGRVAAEAGALFRFLPKSRGEALLFAFLLFCLFATLARSAANGSPAEKGESEVSSGAGAMLRHRLRSVHGGARDDVAGRRRRRHALDGRRVALGHDNEENAEGGGGDDERVNGNRNGRAEWAEDGGDGPAQTENAEPGNSGVGGDDGIGDVNNSDDGGDDDDDDNDDDDNHGDDDDNDNDADDDTGGDDSGSGGGGGGGGGDDDDTADDDQVGTNPAHDVGGGEMSDGFGGGGAREDNAATEDNDAADNTADDVTERRVPAAADGGEDEARDNSDADGDIGDEGNGKKDDNDGGDKHGGQLDVPATAKSTAAANAGEIEHVEPVLQDSAVVSVGDGGISAGPTAGDARVRDLDAREAALAAREEEVARSAAASDQAARDAHNKLAEAAAQRSRYVTVFAPLSRRSHELSHPLLACVFNRAVMMYFVLLVLFRSRVCVLGLQGCHHAAPRHARAATRRRRPARRGGQPRAQPGPDRARHVGAAALGWRQGHGPAPEGGRAARAAVSPRRAVWPRRGSRAPTIGRSGRAHGPGRRRPACVRV